MMRDFQPLTPLVARDGKPSIQGEEYLRDLVTEMRALRAELEDVKGDVADHETRITALEP